MKRFAPAASLMLSALSLVFLGLAPANATTYEFSFSYSGTFGGGSVSGSGDLFGTALGGGDYLLTSGSGTSTEAGNLTLEPAGTYINTLTPSVNLTSDNILDYSSNPVLDGNGIVFSGSSLPSTSMYFNIWGNGPGNYTYWNNYSGPFPAVNGTLDNFSVTLICATPLPSTWTMLIAGFVGFLGFVAFGGKKRNAAATAAA
jgi:hypothetical protein